MQKKSYFFRTNQYQCLKCLFSNLMCVVVDCLTGEVPHAVGQWLTTLFDTPHSNINAVSYTFPIHRRRPSIFAHQSSHEAENIVKVPGNMNGMGNFIL